MNKTIGIFATSSPLGRSPKPTDFSYLKSKGFSIVETPSLRKKTGHTAGNIAERVKDLHSLLKNDSVDILMAYWGGANTNQLLPYLDYDLFKKYKKPIIGFSDTSALLVAVNKKAKIKTYMGPAGITFDKPGPFEYSYEHFLNTVVDPKMPVEIEDSPDYADDMYFLRKDSDHRILQKNSGRKYFKNGRAEGKIVASNLQTLMVLAGTPYFPNLRGKVLFLEEDESVGPAMIHRFFTHLTQATDINELSGVCIGRFMSQSGFKEEDSEEDIYKDTFGNVKYPVVYNLDFGHSDPLFTIPLGGNALIDTKKDLLILS